MLAAAPVQSTHLWTHVLVTVTASFRRVFEARRGRKTAQRHRSVSDSIPSEAIADPVDGMVGRPTRHAFFGAGAACFIVKSEREFQLHIPVLLEMRHRNCQERDGFLVRVIPCLPQAGPNVGGATAGRRLTNVNAISANPMKMLHPCLRGGAAG